MRETMKRHQHAKHTNGVAQNHDVTLSIWLPIR